MNGEWDGVIGIGGFEAVEQKVLGSRNVAIKISIVKIAELQTLNLIYI